MLFKYQIKAGSAGSEKIMILHIGKHIHIPDFDNKVAISD
jgi:hypothetical protein